MRGYLGNTDYDWFSFLKERQPLEEVNFWQPSGGNGFHVLSPGEPFFFRLKKPHYAIAGYGLFARHEVVSAQLAWDAFGVLNGAPDFPSMCRRIEKYRQGKPVDSARQYRVGCLMISQPVFFDEVDWVEEPKGYARNIVSGSGIDVSVGEGRRIWESCLERGARRALPVEAQPIAVAEQEGPRFGAAQLVCPRLGQGTFRVAVTQAYGRACAVTGEHSLPVLDVAHIQGYAEGGPHAVRNGLLLRADIHRLFDRGYVTITPDHKFLVSRRLKDEFENGRAYYKRDGKVIALPGSEIDRPDPKLLRWHNEHVFERGAA